jgi:hypothetical protein
VPSQLDCMHTDIGQMTFTPQQCQLRECNGCKNNTAVDVIVLLIHWSTALLEMLIVVRQISLPFVLVPVLS